ncbi:methyltransferase domain-containing protein [Streptacidiphilus sp. PB12-B1b]|uniref:methyltransferase domain-containing protein n=1 Tax=Streptacidiphilus sp. PB12-B1b TaxID=2705012 RepID=UPI0015FAA914|nr:methyltransferase domain-containing protein [Streptacidiphilus sp. PB12-B1b]QMU79706.1 methyltransferase domain-containing protein [Streptacidiphilus sp. PB12-B1b]
MTAAAPGGAVLVVAEELDAAADMVVDRLHQLRESGDLRTPRWHAALLATPRHAFLPAFHRPDAEGMVAVHQGDRDWLDAVYRNEPLLTQITEGIPTSSSTQPGLMLRMLEALAVADGMSVLEIGTGTGYNAALLAHRLGGANVTTVDVDPALTEPARERLAELGLAVTVATGDGALGHAPRAPYDRVIATCAVRSIPPAWLEQLAPGGLVLATVTTGLHGSALALVGSDGHGRFLPERASFMPMHSQADPGFYALQAQAGPATGERVTKLVPPLDETTAFILGAAMPQVVSFGLPDGDVPGLYLAHRSDGSWAHVLHDGRTVQGGPQPLWDEMEQAHAEWTSAGSPLPHELSITVDGTAQRVHTLDGTLSYALPHTPG